ncbi:hypothetical protein QP162_22080 [Sphingomonas aurantiaca]|uniref:hypothetical protein n=1 Tax=Sphingomonas aurantiaca TaxID=185949 RepID=UPI002FE394EA
MEKDADKPGKSSYKEAGSLGGVDCYLVPEPDGQIHSEKPTSSNEAISKSRGGAAYASAFLDGNYARRKHPTKQVEYTIWDTEPERLWASHPAERELLLDGLDRASAANIFG